MSDDKNVTESYEFISDAALMRPAVTNTIEMKLHKKVEELKEEVKRLKAENKKLKANQK